MMFLLKKKEKTTCHPEWTESPSDHRGHQPVAARREMDVIGIDAAAPHSCRLVQSERKMDRWYVVVTVDRLMIEPEEKTLDWSEISYQLSVL